MPERVVIIGASGHGKVVADVVTRAGDTVVGFLDNDRRVGKVFAGFPVLGDCSAALNFPGCSFVVAIGNATVRERLTDSLQVRWYTAIHPAAVVSPVDTMIGEGTVIMANAVINPGTRIGKHCIINTGAVVDHDNVIGDFCHVSVGVKLAGTVRVGRKTWIGIGSSVSNNLAICEDCMIGAGAVVVENISESGTYVGIPARKIK